MGKKMCCPVCNKRAFDVSTIPKEQIVIELKCPQCGKVVKVPCGDVLAKKAT